MAPIAGVVDVAVLMSAAAAAAATLHFHERCLRYNNSSFRSHDFLTHDHRSGRRGCTHVHQRGKPLGQRGYLSANFGRNGHDQLAEKLQLLLGGDGAGCKGRQRPWQGCHRCWLGLLGWLG